MAPIIKKAGAGSTSKSGASGKNSNSYAKTSNSIGKSGGSSITPKSAKSSTPLTSGKSLSTFTSVGKKYPSFTPPKSTKPSVSLGIIWIPTKKNKKKEIVYNPHNYKYDTSERSPSMYKFMSGDSPNYDVFKKTEEENNSLVPDSKVPLATITSAEVATAAIDVPPDPNESNPDEKQKFLEYDKDETKDAAGDTNEKTEKEDSDFLVNNDISGKPPESRCEKDKFGDKVDSVYLRPPPPHKARSTTSTTEEEDCGIKCLYYTLMCCDCVLM